MGGELDGKDAFTDERNALITVLVVDDEPMVLRVCRRILERAGYSVFTADGAAQAFEVFGQPDCEVDVLVCDIRMSQMDGGELAEELRAKEPALAVIFMSGHAQEDEPCRQFTGECADFLSKPFLAEELLTAISTALSA